LALGFGEGSNSKKERETKMSRPFGVALLTAGFDRLNGPQLFFSDPSGTYFQYKAKAIGSGSEGAQITLQEKFREDLTLIQAEDLALQILKQVMEDKLNNINVEVASVTKNVSFVRFSFFHLSLLLISFPQGYHLYNAGELDTVILRLPAGHVH
jgi:20S proteasome subunit alpha 5